MLRTRHGLVLAVLAAAFLSLASAAAAGAANNGNDFTYTATPLTITGPAMSTLAPSFPGVGNDCTSLFGTPFTLSCYDPKEMREAYNVPSTSTLNGAGQTIIIVDAYGDPNIQQDLATFDSFFGLPAPPSFTVYNGSATQAAGPHAAADWATETALDVEWSHAIAPAAKLVLIETSSSSGNAINTAERQIIPNYPGAIVSQSFGINENAIDGGGNNIQFQQAHSNYALFASLGDTVLASAGDFGATTGTAANTPSYPSSDPLVTAVGGTQGNPYPLGLCPSATAAQAAADICSYGGEEAWNEPDVASVPVATGGAPSQIFSAPSYQAGLTGFNVRTTPDVGYNAAINGGVLVVQLPNIQLVGGTSCGSPQWAGLFALVNQARGLQGKKPIGAANPALYGIYTSPRYGSDFHDVTVGNNTLAGQSVTGFSAGTGYDLTTGIGTPNAANLIGDLAK
jgi:subtilase family serine protease